ncbi:MAG: hypothetical protein EZS28_033751 [Streblomastix strix]|uniref:DDE-1 domain-containing protein n=1 Tax=Streblomastix strix TaxID=222440 RepID=A0A5J4UKH7_9EUKA|nr:MAG: hypothetical protein EZS28_033751 [Streblomastix strix]
MKKDTDQQRYKFDQQTFEDALEGIIDPVKLWLMSGELRDKGISSLTDAIRMVRKSCKAGHIQKPEGTKLAEATKCSPPLVSKLWNNTGYKKVENKESAQLTIEQEQSLKQELKLRGQQIVTSTTVGTQIFQRVTRMKELKGIPVELNANADDVSYQQYCDSHKRMIIVRKANVKFGLHNPVDRGEKRVSVMTGAAQSGDYMLSFVIQRQSVDHFVHLLSGTRQEKDANIAVSEGSNMTNPLFDEWILNCAVPFYDQQRQKIGATLTIPDVLQVDNCRFGDIQLIQIQFVVIKAPQYS